MSRPTRIEVKADANLSLSDWSRLAALIGDILGEGASCHGSTAEGWIFEARPEPPMPRPSEPARST